ncbi:MAG: type II toxin-antitoxin system RelE/ParE family toxin [Bacteroidetes bacterium]|nr:type II toxin-antitoxin system RelE/ParE family toxin [Bacteroidota bacterium]
MEKDWKVKFYKNDEGECPIEDFLNSLSVKDKKKVTVWIKHLREQGINSKRPQSDYLRDGIYELRVKLSRGNTRTLYFFCFETTIILTHAFYKRTNEVPDVEINRALIYKQDILSKYNKETIGEL